MNKISMCMAVSLSLFALLSSGCSQPAGTNGNANTSRNAVALSNDNSGAAMPGATTATPANNNMPLPTTAAPGAAPGMSSAPQPSATMPARTTPIAPAPTPQIGSGANDFFLFTQARSAVMSDGELKNSGVILDVHEGVVTLTGTVANDEQMKKAARLVQGVSGVKSVKNQLRISAGGPKK